MPYVEMKNSDLS